jgi:hypothetical protein
LLGKYTFTNFFLDLIETLIILKTQAAISIWTFEYSDYSQCQPGEFGSNVPDFLTVVKEFRCINMSNGHKLLKPDIDLRSREQQDAFVYVLEVFPGLYCQRVTAGDALPVSTMSQPLLLVAFATAEPPHLYDGTSQNLLIPG